MANFPFQRLQADLSALITRTPAGQRLPSEPDLAKQLGVSRATRAKQCVPLKHRDSSAAAEDRGRSWSARCRRSTAGWKCWKVWIRLRSAWGWKCRSAI
ncbi:MAG: GntR family transcriptional regulator [Chloroflexi bacterium]|nr:GntR family transcriptional regulator [Chloroflexota bacterium]